MVWQRRPCGVKFELSLTEGVIAPKAFDKSCAEVRVQGAVRPKNANGDRLVVVFLVNAQEEPETNRAMAWVFQPELIVRAVPAASNRAIFRRPVLDADGSNPDRGALEMIYRNRVEFAVGHGVAAHALTAEDVTLANEICTTVMPQYEVQVTETPGLDASDRPAMKEMVSSGLLDMQNLATLDVAALGEALNMLTTDYAASIEEQRGRIGADVLGHDAQIHQAVSRRRDRRGGALANINAPDTVSSASPALLSNFIVASPRSRLGCPANILVLTLVVAAAQAKIVLDV